MRHERRTGPTVLERMAAVVAIHNTVALRNLSAGELFKNSYEKARDELNELTKAGKSLVWRFTEANDDVHRWVQLAALAMFMYRLSKILTGKSWRY